MPTKSLEFGAYNNKFFLQPNLVAVNAEPIIRTFLSGQTRLATIGHSIGNTDAKDEEFKFGWGVVSCAAANWGNEKIIPPV